MTKKLRAVPAVILALTLAFSSVTCAFAQPVQSPSEGLTVEQAVDKLAASAADACNDGGCGHSPVVAVPGINHSPTYLYDENDEPVLNKDGEHIGGSLLILDTDPLIKLLLTQLALPLVKMLITQTDSGFPDAAYRVISELFSIQSCDKSGKMLNNLKTNQYGSLASMDESTRSWAYRMIPMQKLTQVIGEDHTYFFTFNLVGNPLDSARELHRYIQNVKRETGHDKVSLLNVSLGGTIFTAYIDMYGWKDIDEVVNAVAATDGSQLIADFFTRGEEGFRVDDEFLYHEYIPRIIEESMDSPTLGYLANILIRIIPHQVLLDTLTRAMDGIMDTMLVNCPQFWALVPSDSYDELSAEYLSAPEYSELKSQTDRYHQAQLNLKKNVLAAKADGVEINSIAGAGLAFGDVEYSYFSIVQGAKTTNSDGIIQLSSTTMGATGAAPGQRLADSYEPAKRGYMSVDGSIDVSTAVLPDNTWIFMGQHHEAGNNDVILTLASAFFTDPQLEDIHSKPDIWPQYNGTCRTKEIRRWLLPEALELKSEIEALPDEEKPDPADIAQLDAAIAAGEAALNMNIADAGQADAATRELTDVLVKFGKRSAQEEPSALSGVFETVFCTLSLVTVAAIGGSGFSDVARAAIKELLKIIAVYA